MNGIISPIHMILDKAGGYALNQRLGKPTTDRFRALLARHLPPKGNVHVLDLGCGIGNYRNCFGEAYTGVDINPAYIAAARRSHRGHFQTMDCTKLGFSDASFDEVVTIATTHHLTDAQLAAMVSEALRVCSHAGHFHLIDAILPVSPNFAFKRFWFSLDRGRFPRALSALRDNVERVGVVLYEDVLPGPLHDTAYLRVGRS